MPGRPKREMDVLRQRALALLIQGMPDEEIAQAVGVSSRTIRRWRRRVDGSQQKTPSSRRTGLGETETALAQMLRAECPAVARVLLDLAKEGDVRAAALVVRLLGNTLSSSEGPDNRGSGTAVCELDRKLGAIPAALASEIVGLLAQAESEAAQQADGSGAASRRAGGRRLHLPWQAYDHPPDQGEGAV